MKRINPLKYSILLRNKTPLVSSMLAGIIAGLCLLGVVMPQATNADFVINNVSSSDANETSGNKAQKVLRKIEVILTAYSSTPEETDDTPFTTASGKTVADGIVANNMLPFGTKIKIPELYGDKIFVVEDRMNKRKSDYQVDIWLPNKPLAINFGIKKAEIEILDN